MTRRPSLSAPGPTPGGRSTLDVEAPARSRSHTRPAWRNSRGGAPAGEAARRRAHVPLAWIIGAGVLGLLGMAVYPGLVGDPAIARMKGEVVSVEPIEGRIEICLADPIDAGSTYGNRVGGELECWSGILADPEPQAGECVIIESQGESAVIGIESAHGRG